MGKHNARRTRRRPESAATARGASSREGYQASGTLEVSPPPAWHSAPPRCRLRISVAFPSFSCLRPTKDSWRGRSMANRRFINSEALPQWVYSTEHPQDRHNTRRTPIHREVRPSKLPPACSPRRVRARRRGQFAFKMRFRIANPWINRSWVNCDQVSFWFQKQESPPFKSIISR